MKIKWHQIDTVLLDMDGTLLDLHFDNFFWLTYLPRRYAEQHGLRLEDATKKLHQHFTEKRGTLDWYCLEYWSTELSVNIRALKEEVKHLIQQRPHAEDFLLQLRAQGKQCVMITNAHPQSLELKLDVTNISRSLDHIFSSHQFGEPKESQQFWQHLKQQQPFDPKRTLFIDDSIDVLRSAQQYGIAHILGINQPDSQKPLVELEEFQTITHFDEISPNG